MGETRFERFVFTLLMCFFMVLGMTIYNLYLAVGPSGRFFHILLRDFWLGFAVALVLDVFIVSKPAKGLALSIIEKRQITILPVKVILISSFMVCGMVLCMSLYGAVKAVGFTPGITGIYPRIVLFNIIAALPLNLLIVNPLVRFLHKKTFPQPEAVH